MRVCGARRPFSLFKVVGAGMMLGRRADRYLPYVSTTRVSGLAAAGENC